MFKSLAKTFGENSKGVGKKIPGGPTEKNKTEKWTNKPSSTLSIS